MKQKINRKGFSQEALRFIVVGVINTIIGTTVMFVAYKIISLGYWLSSMLNYIVGSAFSYFANKYFTFKSVSKSWSEVVRFIVNISACYVVAYGMSRLLALYVIHPIFSGISAEGIDNLAMLGGMGLFVILNFCGQKLFVFSKIK